MLFRRHFSSSSYISSNFITRFLSSSSLSFVSFHLYPCILFNFLSYLSLSRVYLFLYKLYNCHAFFFVRLNSLPCFSPVCFLIVQSLPSFLSFHCFAVSPSPTFFANFLWERGKTKERKKPKKEGVYRNFWTTNP